MVMRLRWSWDNDDHDGHAIMIIVRSVRSWWSWDNDDHDGHDIMMIVRSRKSWWSWDNDIVSVIRIMMMIRRYIISTLKVSLENLRKSNNMFIVIMKEQTSFRTEGSMIIIVISIVYRVLLSLIDYEIFLFTKCCFVLLPGTYRGKKILSEMLKDEARWSTSYVRNNLMDCWKR
jgi:hypothetical protein